LGEQLGEFPAELHRQLVVWEPVERQGARPNPQRRAVGALATA
jgi:hypothetical protein